VITALVGTVIVSSAGSAGASAGAGVGGVATPSTVRLGHAPRLPGGAVAVSPLSGTTPLRVDVVLQPRNPTQLASYASAVSTPGSSQYRHYLSERTFVSRFGPSAGTIESVKRALVGVGLHPGTVSANGLSIPVRATAAQLATAFSTGFEQYRVPGGRVAFANTIAPQVTGTVAPLVQTVVGLDNLTLPTPGSRRATSGGALARPRPEGGSGGPQPCSTAVADATTDGSYTTNQVASAYGFSSIYGQGDLGAGQTVALYELQGYGAGDITAYQSCFGTAAPVSTVDVDGGPLAHSGVGEADVDIEQVLSFAPATHIVVYEGPNTDAGGYDTYNSIVAQDVAKVVSTSWGLCEPFAGSASAQAEMTVFEEAAVQGQTVVAASGDEGSEDCLGSGYSDDTLAVDDPASQPFVTGAGGTSWTALKGATPTETAWNDGPTCCWGAGGGGVSSLWMMPSYQSDVASIGVVNAGSSGVPCGAAAGSYCREVPDVSALAGPFPYLEYVSGSWGSWGGTSLAAPLWASLIALSNASEACAGKNIGFSNPILYLAAAFDPSSFNDVTTGDNDLTGRNGGTYPALAGYDMATGLGTPNGAALPALLCAGASTNTVTVTNPGNQSTDLDAAVSLQIVANDVTTGQHLTYSAVGLPPGLSIDGTSGLITGSVTSPGDFAALVTAKDGTGANSSVGFTWTVTLAITSADSASAVIAQPFSFTVTTTGVPNSIKSSRLPTGLRLRNQGNGTATISGTPNKRDVAGTYPLSITATFGKGRKATVISQAFSLTLTAG
jgi:subtilase family serine protease